MNRKYKHEAGREITEREYYMQEIARKDTEIKRLKKKLKVATQKCRHYKDEMVNISVMERWKLGKYLHDDLAQKLTYLKITISYAREKLANSKSEVISEIDKALKIIDEGANEVRNLSHDIIPVNVEKEGIRETFEYLTEQTKEKHRVNCVLEAGEILQKINCRKSATNLYHITQEAIKNAVIHGDADNIKIHVFKHGDHMHLHIKDDGRGFDNSEKKTGMGLTIMKHRAEEMGGTFSIRNPDDEDYTTCVICIVPLDKLKIKR